MPNDTRSVQDLLNERNRLIAEFEAQHQLNLDERIRTCASPDDEVLDRHCEEVDRLDRTIFNWTHTDASPADLILQAEHAIGFLDFPEDDLGQTDRPDVLAARALKGLIVRLASDMGRRPS